jgi:hypothetical protein
LTEDRSILGDAGDDWITIPVVRHQKDVSAKKITCIIIFSVLVEAPFWQEESQPKPHRWALPKIALA